jgi:hypothetical protein
VINFDTLLEGMVARTDLDLFSYADDAESTWQELVKLGIKTQQPTGSPFKQVDM